MNFIASTVLIITSPTCHSNSLLGVVWVSASPWAQSSWQIRHFRLDGQRDGESVLWSLFPRRPRPGARYTKRRTQNTLQGEPWSRATFEEDSVGVYNKLHDEGLVLLLLLLLLWLWCGYWFLLLLWYGYCCLLLL